MYKSQLQELCQRKLWKHPEYSSSRGGPDHDPCFSALVTVNGVSFHSLDICRTTKAAQNSAAEHAFNHFSGLGSGNRSNESPIGSNCLPSATQNGLEATLTVQSHTGNVMQSPLTHVGVKDKRNSPEGQNLYKNRLQDYAQKRNIGLPVYSCESQGPPHVRKFKCKVTVGGQTYEATDFFPTIKEAEGAAAKIAFEHVSPNEDLEVNCGSYKNVLQELAQKRGYFVPSYDTEGTGPSHLPVFVATVKVANKVYQGLPASSKKQAEANAAKSAYDSLQFGPLHSNEQHQKNGYTKANQQTGPTRLNGQHQQNGNTMENTPMAVSAMKFEPQLKISSPSKEIKEAILSEPTTETAENGFNYPSPMHYQQTAVTNGNGKSSGNPASRDNVHFQKILVYPRSKMPYLLENGIFSVLPCSDEKWVALRMDTNL